MSNYYDNLGFVHDKKNADSNNKFCYSAYAMKVGLLKSLTREMLVEMHFCWVNKLRHSHKSTVPISRDEILGLVYMHPPFAYNLIDGDFWMCVERPVLNPFKFIAQLVLLIKNRKDRNYWHRNNLDQMKFLTMRLPITDRAFVYRMAAKQVPLMYELIERFDRSLSPSGRSSAAIRSFKYDTKDFYGIYNYFEVGHPIRKHMESKK
jgi:hypothetical protein